MLSFGVGVAPKRTMKSLPPLGRWLNGAAFLLLLLTLSSTGFAQTSNGTLVGTVLDTTGAAIANAKIEATNTGTGVAVAVTSGANGEYRVGNLLAGTYSVTGSATGFSNASIGNIAVEANRTVTQNI